MNINVEKKIDECLDYIKNEVFKDFHNLGNNLFVIKENMDLEWFNCALIAKESLEKKGNKVGTRSYIASKTEISEEEIDMNSLNPGSIILIAPFLEEDHIDFCLQSVFRIKDFKLNDEKYSELTREPLIDELEKQKKVEIDEAWIDNYINVYLKQFAFYYDADQSERTLYHNALYVVFENEILGKDPEMSKIQISLKDKTDPIVLYRNLYKLITKFPSSFAYTLRTIEDAFEKTEKQVGKQADQIRQKRYCFNDRLRKAKKR